jgi:hypothetical protein
MLLWDAGATAIFGAIGGLLVSGSPFAIRVAPARASPLRSFAAGLPLSSPVSAGILAYLMINFLDDYGNVALFSESNVSLSFLFVDGLGMVHAPSAVTLTFLEEFALLQYNITSAGPFELAIEMTSHSHAGSVSAPIWGSPYALSVIPAEAVASQTQSRGLGLRMATVGTPASFHLTLRDLHGNDVSDLHFLRLKMRGVEFFNGSELMPPSCVQDTYFSYNCNFTAVYAGRHEMQIELVSSSGLNAQYFNGALSPEGEELPVLSRIDPVLNFVWAGAAYPLGALYNQSLSRSDLYNRISIIWNGFLVAPKNENFQFSLKSVEMEGSVFVEDRLLFRSAEVAASGTVDLLAYNAYSLRVEVTAVQVVGAVSASISLQWRSRYSAWTDVPAKYLFSSSSSIRGSPFAIAVTGR